MTTSDHDVLFGFGLLIITAGICIIVGLMLDYFQAVRFGRSPKLAKRCGTCGQIYPGALEEAQSYNEAIRRKAEDTPR